MKFADVHAHLYLPEFDADRAAVIKKAADVGCVAIINNATDPQSWPLVMDLAAKHTICKAACGIYPDDIDRFSDELLTEHLSKLPINIVAIGEIGLDYKYTMDQAKQERQRTWFIAQLDLAVKRKVPVIIHSRGAEQDVVDILCSRKPQPAVLHCFAGSVEIAKRALDHGIHFSVPVRAVSSKSFWKIIEAAPLKQLLTETDAPYLHYKQERNEPANITHTIDLIAKIKKIDPLETSHILLFNYIKLFSKK